ncbi:hypothetical protein NCCNTM_43050 [Mycolicibacterium sp. NCC-Tsukiji]|nr:hypothetical protein NCCNTM_43050 [Mycolicibacterium sp. NCC-Tsukiji]
MQFALRVAVFGRPELDVQRAQQTGQAQLDGRVGGRVDITVEPHGDQRVPTLPLDLGDRADRDVGNPDPRILLQVGDIRHLRLDLERSGPTALGTGQRQAVGAAPVRAAGRGQ